MNFQLNRKQTVDSRQGYLTIGNFDGVHRGHQCIISKLVELSRNENVPSTVLTFEPHPVTILAPEFAPPLLTTLKKKTELLKNLGVDHVIALPVTQEFLELSSADFFTQIIVEQFQAKGLIEGPNFYFGKDRKGNPELLAQYCQKEGMILEIIRPEATGEEMISSTLIRKLILEGEMPAVTQLLGRPYSIGGTVIKGEQRGRSLGFPTANLENIPVLIPADGVYAACTEISGVKYAVALNIGPNPTFKEQNKKIEAHLLNFSRDLYHSTLEISIVERIRSISTFPSVEQLTEQLRKDVEFVEKIIDCQT
jgi:riboflavin kinase / FMN adenylyltransferase